MFEIFWCVCACAAFRNTLASCFFRLLQRVCHGDLMLLFSVARVLLSRCPHRKINRPTTNTRPSDRVEESSLFLRFVSDRLGVHCFPGSLLGEYVEEPFPYFFCTRVGDETWRSLALRRVARVAPHCGIGASTTVEAGPGPSPRVKSLFLFFVCVCVCVCLSACVFVSVFLCVCTKSGETLVESWRHLRANGSLYLETGAKDSSNHLLAGFLRSFPQDDSFIR